jgi:UDP-N-acetylglucosamine--N-acetylmuramyl-(pentapeptide) pyrophosphoryl-undecaprenol N-acetylglucosamine transferase
LRHVLFAGGGTGGHVFPALAVAAELQGRGCAVSFLGTAQGLEARLVPACGYAFTALAAQPLVGRGPRERLRALWTLARSAAAARRLVRGSDIQCVVGTGGYASAPGVLGGRWAGRPVLLLELNAHAGVANRWLSLLASGATVAAASTARELRCATWVTGVPVRSEFFEVASPAPMDPGEVRVLVLGGSQGARSLNRDLPLAIAELRSGNVAWRVLHQAGARHLEEATAAYAAAGLLDRVEVVPFLDDVAGAMGRSHLIVARAGAMTLAELQAAGRPALLLPLGISGGHQIANAEAAERAGAALVLRPHEATPARLAALLGELVADRQRLAGMGLAARRLANRGAAVAIVERIEGVVAGAPRVPA